MVLALQGERTRLPSTWNAFLGEQCKGLLWSIVALASLPQYSFVSGYILSSSCNWTSALEAKQCSSLGSFKYGEKKCINSWFTFFSLQIQRTVFFERTLWLRKKYFCESQTNIHSSKRRIFLKLFRVLFEGF